MANEFIARKGIISLDSIQVSGSITATGGITISGSISSASFATTSATASSADNFFVRQNLTASSALFTGSITAQTLVVQTVTSSIVYSSGSNIFGSQLTDTQRFTGSMFITGSSVLFNGDSFNMNCSGISNRTMVIRNTAARGIAAEFVANDGCATIYIIPSGSGGTNMISSNYVRGTVYKPLALSGRECSTDFVLCNGSVGIGTSSPNDKLEVNGAIFTTANTVLTTTKGAIFDFNDGQDAGRMLAYKSTGANLLFYTNASGGGLTERMRITSGGNIGIGVTPASWTLLCPVQIRNVSVAGYTTGNTHIFYAGNNWYYGGSDKYITNGFASLYSQADGAHVWYNASCNISGADAALTFCERMRLTCDGHLLVGTTTNLSFLSQWDNGVIRIGKGGLLFSYANNDESLMVSQNYYVNTSGNDVRVNATGASNIFMTAGTMYFRTAGSSTAGSTISWNNPLTLTSTGQAGIGTTSTSTEANLFLGAQSAGEGGQLVLQKGTSCSCATHLDNYQDTFRVLVGSDTTSTGVHMLIDHKTRAACFYGALYVPETYIQGPTISYAAQLNPAGPAYTQDLQLVICHSNWGGNDDTGTVYVEYAARAYAVSQTTAAYGTMTYRLNNGGTQIGSFGTGGVTTSCVTITGDVATSRVLKINFAVSQNVDRISIFARTTNPFVTSVTGILV